MEIVKNTIEDILTADKKRYFEEDVERLLGAQFKKKSIFYPFPKSITTVNKTIYLARNFLEWTAVNQQAVLLHEAWHLKQYAEGKLSIPDYLTSRLSRFKIEYEAERRETLYRCYIGDIGESRIGEYAINMANTWPQQYFIASLKNTAQWFQLFRSLCEESFAFLRANP